MNAILIEGYVPKNQADLEIVKNEKLAKSGFMQDLQQVYSKEEAAENTKEREGNEDKVEDKNKQKENKQIE